MSKERRGEGGAGHMKLWQSLGRTDQPKTKKTGRRQRHGSVWRENKKEVTREKE